MKFKFTASVVVEASSEEDALKQIGWRIAVIERHLGSGVALADNSPFFQLDTVTEGEVTDLDPVRTARLATEAQAAAEAPLVVVTRAETGPAETPTAAIPGAEGETK